MILVILSGLLVLLAFSVERLVAAISETKARKISLMTLLPLWGLFLAWSWTAYPALQRKEVQVHDHGVLTSVTPGGGNGPAFVETSDGSVIRLYPQFPLRQGERVLQKLEFEGGSAMRYYDIGNRRHDVESTEWNMPSWRELVKHYPGS